MDLFLYGLLIVAVLLGLWFISTMNRFRVLQVKINEALSGIDVALTKRFDVLTKMWDLAKKYMEYEQSTLEKVVKLRQGAKATVSDQQELNQGLNEMASQLNVVLEQYPELRATENMKELQRSVRDVEEHLQAARRLYNANVSTFNQSIIVFPNSVVANAIKATKAEFFEAEDRKRSDVTFN
jgi:LemA protein